LKTQCWPSWLWSQAARSTKSPLTERHLQDAVRLGDKGSFLPLATAVGQKL
jgi:hypothetical protein